MVGVQNKHKFWYLDGLRGVAALVVVFHHFAYGFFPAIKTGALADVHSRWDLLIYRTPLNIFFAGNVCVSIFFVLSGFVLSYKFVSTGDHEALSSSSIRRYFRLMPPVLGSVIVGYALMRFHLFYNALAYPFTHSLWLYGFWQFTISIRDALYQGLVGTFLYGQDSYNTNLWTMQIEFLGSFLVFMSLALFGKSRWRVWIYAILAVGFRHTYLLAFLAGMALCDFWVNGAKDRVVEILKRGWYIPVALLAILLSSVPDQDSPYNIIGKLDPPNLTYQHFMMTAHMFAGFLVVLLALTLPSLQKLLGTKIAQYLGRISFSLYLIHLLVIGSFASYLFIHLPTHMAYGERFALTFIPSFIIILISAEIFTLYLDQPAIRLSGRWYKKLFSKPTSNKPKSETMVKTPAVAGPDARS